MIGREGFFTGGGAAAGVVGRAGCRGAGFLPGGGVFLPVGAGVPLPGRGRGVGEGVLRGGVDREVEGVEVEEMTSPWITGPAGRCG